MEHYTFYYFASDERVKSVQKYKGRFRMVGLCKMCDCIVRATFLYTFARQHRNNRGGPKDEEIRRKGRYQHQLYRSAT